MAANDKKVVISIPAGAGLYPLGLAEATKIQDMIKAKYPEKHISFAGISSGSWIALLLALNLTFVEIKNYFLDFQLLFNAFYKTCITHWFINLEILFRRILAENGGYKKLENRLFVGMTSWCSEQRRFVFQIANQFNSDNDVINAVMASSHVLFVGRGWIRYYHGKISFDGNFMKFNVVLDNEKYINILIKYRYIRSPLDSMVSYSLKKFNRLCLEGIGRFEENKLKYIQQIELNETLPQTYYQSVITTYFQHKRKRKTAFFMLIIVAFFQFLGISF